MHHSSEHDVPIPKEFYKDIPKLGPTGQFPDGKLTPSDKGEIRIAIANSDGNVILDLGPTMGWIAFDPSQAFDLARTIRKHAKQAQKDILKKRR